MWVIEWLRKENERERTLGKNKSAYVFIHTFLQPLLRLSECPITVARYGKI